MSSTLSDRLRLAAAAARAPVHLPYTLLSLREACAPYGITQDEVLEIAHRLHENGYISYPRTETPYLSSKELAAVADTLFDLRCRFDVPGTRTWGMRVIETLSPVWNNPLIKDWHGIIPVPGLTADRYDELSATDKIVYDLIVKSYLALFEESQKRENFLPEEILSLLDEAASAIDTHADDVSDENKGLWRFWNRKARELASSKEERTYEAGAI